MLDQNDNEKFNSKCEEFLAQIERMDAEIHAATSDKAHLKRLERNKADIRRAFAAHLRNNDKDSYQNASWSVWARWVVEGVPSQKAKEQAAAWMETQNFFGWKGFAPQLRSNVSSALREEKPIPDGYFGLHVEWTVDVYPLVRYHESL